MEVTVAESEVNPTPDVPMETVSTEISQTEAEVRNDVVPRKRTKQMYAELIKELEVSSSGSVKEENRRRKESSGSPGTSMGTSTQASYINMLAFTPVGNQILQQQENTSPDDTKLREVDMQRSRRNSADETLLREVEPVFVRPYAVSDSEAVVKKKGKKGNVDGAQRWIPPSFIPAERRDRMQEREWRQNVKYLWATAPKSVKIKGKLSFFGSTGRWILKESDSIDSVSNESPAPSPASVTSATSVESDDTINITLGDTAAELNLKARNKKERSGNEGIEEEGIKQTIAFQESDLYCFTHLKYYHTL